MATPLSLVNDNSTVTQGERSKHISYMNEASCCLIAVMWSKQSIYSQVKKQRDYMLCHPDLVRVVFLGAALIFLFLFESSMNSSLSGWL